MVAVATVRTSPDQQVVKLALDEIEARTGNLEPDAVVDEARDPSHVLHDRFQWDDSIAAHEYRLEQARALIRYVKIPVVTITRDVRVVAFVRNPDMPMGRQGYRSVDSLRQAPDAAERAVLNELDRVASAVNRCRSIAAAFELSEMAEKRLREIVG